MSFPDEEICMKILALNGSLRRGGSTEGTLELLQGYLRENYPGFEMEVVMLCEKRILRCDSDYECDRKGRCALEDDVGEIVERMIAADAILYVLPVHAFGTNSLMQTFLERAGVGYLRFKRPLEGRLAGIVVTGRRYSHEMVWAQIALNIMLNKMVLIGSGFPAVIKNDGKQLHDQILDEEGMSSLKGMIKSMCDFLDRNAQSRFAGSGISG